MNAPLAEIDPADAASFAFWTEEILRFSDLDVVGHVNNNAVGTFLENGRVRLFLDSGEDMAAAARGRGFTWVVRRLEIDFAREIRFPGRVRTGTRVVRLGNTSCTIRQGVFVEGACCVTAMSIGVCFDPAERKAIPIPGNVRELLLTATRSLD